jgi:MFS family permease
MHIPVSLRYRQFRLLWFGLMISVAGSEMQTWALLWHVRTLSKLPIALGAIGLARVAPIMLFSLIGGTLADSKSRRLVLFFTQGAMAATSLALALLTFTNRIELWEMYVLTGLSAVAVAFDGPARNAIIANLVPAAHLPNAFSMISIARKTGAICGPALSGLVIASLGQGYTYLLNALSFTAVILALVLMGNIPQAQSRTPLKLLDFGAIWAGIQFVRKSRIVLATMLLDFLATFFSSANALLPIYVVDIFRAGGIAYGWLSAAQAIGATTAALVISQRKGINRQGRVLLISVWVFGLATVAFGLSRTFASAMVALIVVGASDAVSTILRNTIRQMQTPDDLRGRMVSINQMFYLGGPQLGELEAGALAQITGAPIAVVSGGIATVGVVVWAARRWPSRLNYRGDEPTPHVALDEPRLN